MSIKINTLPNISFPNQSDTEIDRKTKPTNDGVAVNLETSPPNGFHTLTE